jgi:hypothetical protein
MKIFKDLPWTEQVELLEAMLNNPKSVEVWIENSEWRAASGAAISFNAAYRIKPTPITLDWSVLHEDVRWVARDKDGSVWAYRGTEPPVASERYRRHVLKLGYMVRISGFLANLDKGTVPWEESLIERPKD